MKYKECMCHDYLKFGLSLSWLAIAKFSIVFFYDSVQKAAQYFPRWPKGDSPSMSDYNTENLDWRWNKVDAMVVECILLPAH